MSAWSARAVLGASLFLPLPPALAEQAVGTLPPEAVQVLEQAGIRAPGVGAYIVEPGAGRPLVQVAADQPFTAASTMKLVTTIAAPE